MAKPCGISSDGGPVAAVAEPAAPAAEPSVDLSIVIVSYNVRDYLAACLGSLAEGTDRLRVETVVVDNASADGSAGLCPDASGCKETLPAWATVQSSASTPRWFQSSVAAIAPSGASRRILKSCITCSS